MVSFATSIGKNTGVYVCVFLLSGIDKYTIRVLLHGFTFFNSA